MSEHLDTLEMRVQAMISLVGRLRQEKAELFEIVRRMEVELLQYQKERDAIRTRLGKIVDTLETIGDCTEQEPILAK